MPDREMPTSKFQLTTTIEHRSASLRDTKTPIANIMRLLCLGCVLGFGVICGDTVGVEGELADFTAELLRA